jgi:hypothetical protein
LKGCIASGKLPSIIPFDFTHIGYCSLIFLLTDYTTFADNCNTTLAGLRFCDQPRNQSEWSAILENVFVVSYTQAAQFNQLHPHATSKYKIGNPLEYIINGTLAANNSADVLRIPSLLLQGIADPVYEIQKGAAGACLNASNPNFATFSANGIEALPFIWITCHYIPLAVFARQGNEGDIFPAHLEHEWSGNVICPYKPWQTEALNQTNEWWINHYGFSKENLQKIGRIITTHALTDPTTSDGRFQFDVSSDRMMPRSYTASGIGHTEESFSRSIYPAGENMDKDRVSPVTF